MHADGSAEAAVGTSNIRSTLAMGFGDLLVTNVKNPLEAPFVSASAATVMIRCKLMPPPESNLVYLLRVCSAHNGQHPACGEFFDKGRQKFFRIAWRIGRLYGATAEDIEDHVQEICTKFAQKMTTLSAQLPTDDQQADSYIAVMAANACRDCWNARNVSGLQVPLEDQLELLDLQALRGSSQREEVLKEVFRQAESILPPRDLIVFRLYYWSGFSAREISSMPTLGLKESGVESLLRKATLRIQQRFRFDS